jgi:hypothetical protein
MNVASEAQPYFKAGGLSGENACLRIGKLGRATHDGQ